MVLREKRESRAFRCKVFEKNKKIRFRGAFGLLICLGFLIFPASASFAEPSSRPVVKKKAVSQPVSQAAAVVKKKVIASTKSTVKKVLLKKKRVKQPASRPVAGPLVSRMPQTAKKKTSRKVKRLNRLVLHVENILTTFLMKHGRDPNNPWLLSHSVLALGKELKLKNGQKAIDRIVSGYLKFKTVNKHTIPYFEFGTKKQRIEPHPHMHLKTFLESGVPMSYKFKVGARSVTLRQMFEGAKLSFPFDPKKAELGRLAWLFSIIYGRIGKRVWAWKNAKQETVVLIRLVWRAFSYLDRNTSFLRGLKSRGVKIIPKRGQYIYKEACGGFHLLQSLLQWMGHPQIRERVSALREAQIELMFYRLDGEIRLYTKLFKKHQKNPGYRFIILLQQLKFLGHLVETMSKLKKWGLLKPTTEQVKKLQEATHLLTVTILLLDRLGFFQNVLQLKKAYFQFYLDLLGDSAHALHGLKLAREVSLFHD